LVAHTAKAASRLASNTSPEPFSNIGLSLGEDAAVLCGLALMHFNPLLALIILLIAIGAFFYFALRILRATKAKIWLAWKKLNGPADRGLPVKLPDTLPARLATVFGTENVLGATVAWAAPCISGRGRRIPANLFGALVGTNEERAVQTDFRGAQGSTPVRAHDRSGECISESRTRFSFRESGYLSRRGEGSKILIHLPAIRCSVS
ncbi:MAG: hypothetical protein DMF33_12850, partial [Verrucomicrobia bacterium]